MSLGQLIKLEDAPRGARIIVCGGRTYGVPIPDCPSELVEIDSKRVEAQRVRLFGVLDLLSPKEIAQGEAHGADALAREWAVARGVRFVGFHALWETDGQIWAGRRRNRRMFSGFAPDGTVSFPGGTGTADMESVTLENGAWLVRVDRAVIDPDRHRCGACSRGNHSDCSGWCFCTCEFNR